MHSPPPLSCQEISEIEGYLQFGRIYSRLPEHAEAGELGCWNTKDTVTTEAIAAGNRRKS